MTYVPQRVISHPVGRCEPAPFTARPTNSPQVRNRTRLTTGGWRRPARAARSRSAAAVVAVSTATGVRVSELAGICYDAEDARRSDVDLWNREITIRGKGGKARIVRTGRDAAGPGPARAGVAAGAGARGGPRR